MSYRGGSVLERDDDAQCRQVAPTDHSRSEFLAPDIKAPDARQEVRRVHARSITPTMSGLTVVRRVLTRHLVAMLVLAATASLCNAQEMRVSVSESLGRLTVENALVTARREGDNT